LNLKCDFRVSKFAFAFNLCRYTVELGQGEHGEEGEEGEGGHLGVHKHGSPTGGSELDDLLKELEGLSASDLEKSIKLAGQGRKQRDRVKEDEDIFKRRSDDEANKPRKNKKKKKSLAAVPLFKRQGKKKDLGTAGGGGSGGDIAADGASQEDALAATISGGRVGPFSVGTFHHLILQSKHKFMTAPVWGHVTNLTPGSGNPLWGCQRPVRR
jgi:hypothetical protein